jgi:hypothetical protein
VRRPDYTFAGFSPGLPPWFVGWISDRDAAVAKVEFGEIKKKLGDEHHFSTYMAYRDRVGIHPTRDLTVSFVKAKTPTGVPVLAIQDAGIAHVYTKGAIDLEEEKKEALRQGFRLLQNPGRRANPVWKVDPFEIHIEQGRYDEWEYVVHLGDEEILSADGFEVENDALRHAMKQIEQSDLWREPDYKDEDTSLWWGPHDNLVDSENVTEVTSDGCVSEYTFVGEYEEGVADDQWIKITVCPDEPLSSHPRILVGIGVSQIGEYGGVEKVLTADDIFIKWPEVSRKDSNLATTNPASIKARLLSLDPRWS